MTYTVPETKTSSPAFAMMNSLITRDNSVEKHRDRRTANVRTAHYKVRLAASEELGRECLYAIPRRVNSRVTYEPQVLTTLECRQLTETS